MNNLMSAALQTVASPEEGGAWGLSPNLVEPDLSSREKSLVALTTFAFHE